MTLIEKYRILHDYFDEKLEKIINSKKQYIITKFFTLLFITLLVIIVVIPFLLCLRIISIIKFRTVNYEDIKNIKTDDYLYMELYGGVPFEHMEKILNILIDSKYIDKKIIVNDYIRYFFITMLKQPYSLNKYIENNIFDNTMKLIKKAKIKLDKNRYIQKNFLDNSMTTHEIIRNIKDDITLIDDKHKRLNSEIKNKWLSYFISYKINQRKFPIVMYEYENKIKMKLLKKMIYNNENVELESLETVYRYATKQKDIKYLEEYLNKKINTVLDKNCFLIVVRYYLN